MDKFGKLMEVIDEAIEEAELEVGNAEANCENWKLINPDHEDACDCSEGIMFAMCEANDLKLMKEFIIKKMG